jgi:hypothetical protein
MQENTAKTEAGKFGNHGLINLSSRLGQHA